MFYLIWIVILLAGVTVYGIQKRSRILSQFVSLTLLSAMAPGADARRRWIKGCLLITGCLLATLALTGPQVGFRWEKVEQKGVDIMIALDCSRSMLATDIKPTRLEQAKREIIDLLKMMQSDRAGLVAFSGSAFLQCPLTLDHSGFSLFLKALNPDYLPMGGTDLSGAIATALEGFEWDVASEKAIIIITDGENTSGDPLDIAQIAADKGVRIFCIGVGQKEGAPIPDADGGFKKDASGSIIMSRVDDAGLEKIAALARGIYVKSVAGDMDLDLIYKGEILKNMERTTIQSGRKKVWENRFQWVLLPCVLILFLELMIGEKKKNSSRNTLLPLILFGVSTAVYMGLFSVTKAHAGASKSVARGIEAFQQGQWEKAEKSFIDAQLDRPDMPELYYNIGSAAYKKEDYESAIANFTKAMDTDDETLKQKALFNRGNTQYRRGNLEEAVKSFEQIPETSPLFHKASENIEFVKQKIEEKKNAPRDQQSSKDGENKESQDREEKDSGKDTGDSRQQQNDQQDQDSRDKEQEQDKKEEKQPGAQPDSRDSKFSDKNKSSRDPSSKPHEEQKKPGAANAGDDDKKEAEGRQQATAENKEEGKTDEKDKGAGRAGEQSRGMGALQPQQQQMLDRLEDQPGGAMIPAYSGGRVEKDW
ncbi:VWA domain-containing protein [Desulfocicer vacuolatum]|nr:VWA domain-containing protein [Desulfocicer vacuolatum]